MQILILLLIVVTLTFPPLAKVGWLPGFVPYLFEVLGAFALIIVVALGVRDRFQYVRPAYWFVFGSIALTMLCGVLINAVGPGPMFAGLRIYLRAIPLFFLPCVFHFTERQLRTQILLLLMLCLIQLPIAVAQRLGTMAKGAVTGDETSGTLMISSILSIFLICAISVLTAFYRRKRLSTRAFVVLFLLLIFPTTINETKGTLFLLPIALIVTLLVVASRGTRLKNVLLAVGLLSVFSAIFIPIYDYLVQGQRYPTTIEGFFTQEGRLEGYLYKEAEIGAKSEWQAGRVDAIVVPLSVLARDPAHLVFGLGIGNASDSALGVQFVGRYYKVFEPFLLSGFARLVLELGVLGVALVMLLYWLIFTDSRIVAAYDNNQKGALAAGWTGVTAVFAVSTFYKDLITFEALSCLFWFYAGLIAAERMRIANRARLI
jgi:hypothetical protein